MLTLEITKKSQEGGIAHSLHSAFFFFFFLDTEHIKESLIKGFHQGLPMIWLAFLMNFLLLESKRAAYKPLLSLAGNFPPYFVLHCPE